MSDYVRWRPSGFERYVFIAMPGYGCTIPGSVVTAEGVYVPASAFVVVKFGGEAPEGGQSDMMPADGTGGE